EVFGASQLIRHESGDPALVMADRRDLDQLCCESEQVVTPTAHIDASCSRSISFSIALSCRSPGVRCRTTSTHGRKNSPEGNSLRRIAPTATHHGGTYPRPSSSPDQESMTGIDGFRIVPSPRTAPSPTRAP